MKSIAIIPARGGSKRIPNKNIKDFLGYPIIKYVIETAIDSKCFDEVIVSTDSKKIASLAEKFGASVPFLRSPKSSNDHATTADVISEVIENYRKRNNNFDFFCCLYPTSIFVTSQLLNSAFDQLKGDGLDGVISVMKYRHPIERAFKIDDGNLSMLYPENVFGRTQDFVPKYHDAGQFYFMKTDAFLREKKIFTSNIRGFVLPFRYVQDIDTEEDWYLAELKYNILKNQN
ncbi:MAG: pseudaminic acid cytidylyltransferase [Patescibacteria group bacterium]|jgi:N-acylneuraminate cytidylyltransferase|nr:pseudaminic acid cytidylyltransferase [Patescibacteria group bacterium]